MIYFIDSYFFLTASLLGASSGSLPKPQDQCTQTDELLLSAGFENWSSDFVQQWLKQNDLGTISDK